jgi:phosphate transport system substrate-binding protein
MKRKQNRMALLAAALAAAGLATAAARAENIVIDGSTTVGPVAKAFAEYYMKANPSVNITVSESGSGNGAKSLINGTCDIATMSRPMKTSEKDSAEGSGILPIEHTVAMDGLAVIVHPSNPVQKLTIEQIRRIYTGEIRNWKELGGPDKPIVLVSRDTNSGTYECFETLVLNKQKISGAAEYVGSNGAVRDRVRSTDAAIGYAGLAFTEGVKPLEVSGVAANAENVLNATYPIARPLFMYTNGRPKLGSHLSAFINLSRSPDGMRMVEDVGYVPMR